MKFFNKKALTLAELITSIVIIGALSVIIFVFATANIEELTENDIKIRFTEEFLNFQEIISNFDKEWYSIVKIISIPNNSNWVLCLKKEDLNAWVLVWIVNLDTKMIQQNYIYWDNFIAYRELSSDEIAEIDSDNDIVFTKIFQIDKIFQGLRVKDFVLEPYNNWKIVDLYVSFVKKFSNLFWQNFEDLSIENIVIWEYNLTF